MMKIHFETRLTGMVRQRLASEDIVLNIPSMYTIVKLSNQYGYDVKGKNFVHQALEKLTANEPVSADDDIISSPTYIGTTVSSIQEIIMYGHDWGLQYRRQRALIQVSTFTEFGK